MAAVSDVVDGTLLVCASVDHPLVLEKEHATKASKFAKRKKKPVESMRKEIYSERRREEHSPQLCNNDNDHQYYCAESCVEPL